MTTIAEWKVAESQWIESKGRKGGLLAFSADELHEWRGHNPVPVVARFTNANSPTYDVKCEYGGGYWCEIPTSRCDSPAKLVDWIQHLNDKTWFTKEHLRQFLEVVFEHNPRLVDRSA